MNINCKLSFTTFRIWCHYNWDMINIVFIVSLFVSFFSSKLQSSFTNMQKTDVTVVIWHVVFGRSNLYNIYGVLFRNTFAHFRQLWLIFNDNFFTKMIQIFYVHIQQILVYSFSCHIVCLDFNLKFNLKIVYIENWLFFATSVDCIH